MTLVQIESGNGFKKILAEGHANYSEAGTDIVCASVSILLQTFMYHCQTKEQENCIEIIEQQLDSGHIEFVINDSKGYTDDSFEMLTNGIKLLEESYPEYVMLIGEK